MHDIAFDIAKNTKHDGYQRILVLMGFLIKKLLLGAQINLQVVQLKTKIMSNQSLENLKNKKYTHCLQIVFAVLIFLICN